MSWPSIHKAGQTPRARGIFIRACISPYRNETRVPADQPRGGVPAAAVPPAGQLRINPPGHDGQIPGPVEGRIARLIGVILQFLVSHPEPPVSARQGPLSAGVPGAPSNSSDQASLYAPA